MNRELVNQLSKVTDEEREILKERAKLDAPLWIEGQKPEINCRKLLAEGKLVSLFPCTRFVHFSSHKHPYSKAIYMCHGQTVHQIDGVQIVVKKGELLLISQGTEVETLPAGKNDLAIDFVILPEFFDRIFQVLEVNDSLLRDFLVECLKGDADYSQYLHFQVSDVLPVQNLIENMVWMMIYGQAERWTLNQNMMGLLLVLLSGHMDKIRKVPQTLEQNLVLDVLQYIDKYYQEGQMNRLCAIMGYDIYWLSRTIKKLTGKNYKDLLQIRRLNQAAYLLLSTTRAVSSICNEVGYDNTSYFHRLFRGYYGMSPKEYRKVKKIKDNRIYYDRS